MPDWLDLNARHIAIFVWCTVFLLFFSIKSPQVRKSIYGIIRSLSNPDVLLAIIGLTSTAMIATVVMEALRYIFGFGGAIPLVTVTFWLFTSGLSLLLNLVGFYEPGRAFFKKAKDIVGPAAVVTALVNFSVLPLWLELSLFPFLTVLTMVSVLGDVKDEKRKASTLAKVLLATYVGFLIFLALKTLLKDPSTWASLAQTFFFPILLTIITLAYIKLIIISDKCWFEIGSICRTIRSSDYGRSWPLTVESAKLCCRFKAVWVEVKGNKYGLNGTAKTMLPRFGHTCLDLEEIWKDQPNSGLLFHSPENHLDTAKLKVNIGPLIQEGLALETHQ